MKNLVLGFCNRIIPHFRWCLDVYHKLSKNTLFTHTLFLKTYLLWVILERKLSALYRSDYYTRKYISLRYFYENDNNDMQYNFLCGGFGSSGPLLQSLHLNSPRNNACFNGFDSACHICIAQAHAFSRVAEKNGATNQK